MASIDVSDAFDPSFMDSGIVCMRPTQTIDDNGIASNAFTNTSFSAVVVPKEGTNMVRLPDGSRVEETLSMYTLFTLQAQRPGLSADIVVWKGAQYTVKGVDPYTNFGRGFIVAECEIIPLGGA